MAINRILTFAQEDTGSNLDSQNDYQAAADRIRGNQPGVARLRLVNKALKQASLMAAGLAEFIALRQSADVNDTLTPAQVAAMFSTAATYRDAIYFGNPGTSTWTVPAGVTRVRGRVWGAGGGGGGTTNGAASGGGGGGYAEGWFSVTPGQQIAITVGFGGAGGTGAPTAGSNGTASSIGAFFGATGGGGGQGAGGGGVAPVTALVGEGYGGQINIRGNPSNAGIIVGGTFLGSAGGGTFGVSVVGGFSNGPGNGYAFPGGGGGGAGGNTFAAGNVGSGGLVALEW